MKLKVRKGSYYQEGDDRRLKMRLCRLELFSGQLDFHFLSPVDLNSGSPVLDPLI